jgi:hypothetical protein
VAIGTFPIIKDMLVDTKRLVGLVIALRPQTPKHIRGGKHKESGWVVGGSRLKGMRMMSTMPTTTTTVYCFNILAINAVDT